MTRTWTYCLLVPLILTAVPYAARGGPPRGESVVGGFGRPAFLEYVFRPETIMRNQSAIGLSAEQREAITAALRETQQRLLTLQWQREARSEEAAKLFAADRIDLEPAMARAAAVMEVEDEIKREHLRLLVRIKNELTPEQQEKLRQLRPARCSDKSGDR